MKSISIQGQKRENVGKAATRALRNAEQVPCVVYGNQEVIHFSTSEKALNPLVFNIRKLKVKALPVNLPDTIEVDLTDVGIGDKKYIADLKTDKYTFLHPDNAVVAAVKTSRTAIKTNEETPPSESA